MKENRKAIINTGKKTRGPTNQNTRTGKETQSTAEGDTKTGKQIQSIIEGDPGRIRLTRRVRWSQVPGKVPGKKDHTEGVTRKQTQEPGMKTQDPIEDDRKQ